VAWQSKSQVRKQGNVVLLLAIVERVRAGLELYWRFSHRVVDKAARLAYSLAQRMTQIYMTR